MQRIDESARRSANRYVGIAGLHRAAVIAGKPVRPFSDSRWVSRACALARVGPRYTRSSFSAELYRAEFGPRFAGADHFARLGRLPRGSFAAAGCTSHFVD